MLNNVKIRDGHDNFFTPLRLLFAIIVVFGHSFNAAQRGALWEPLFFHHKYSYVAVNLFFIVSGFLVTKSILYRGDITEFGTARFLRIYPGLIAFMLFVMFIMGPLVTSLPLIEYLTHVDVLKQPFLVLSFIEPRMFLPETFTSNLEQMSAAPLWTLGYEILAYIVTAILFSLGFLKKKWMVLAQFIVPSFAWMIIHTFGMSEDISGEFRTILRFGIAYGLGAAIFAYRDRLTFHRRGILALILLTVLTNKLPVFEVIMNVMLAYIVMWAAFVKAPRLEFLKKLSDVSYGVYIYHWVVLQYLYIWLPDLPAIGLFLTALPITYFLASVSWHVVEKPMLTKKKSFSKVLRFGRKVPSYDARTVLLD